MDVCACALWGRSAASSASLLTETFLCVPGGLRVFYKVKSRSAHMKSHAEQEKKAAALRQKEKEAAAAAAAAAATPHQPAQREESGLGDKG